MFLCKKELPPLNIMRENSAKCKTKTKITELRMEDKKKMNNTESKTENEKLKMPS